MVPRLSEWLPLLLTFVLLVQGDRATAQDITFQGGEATSSDTSARAYDQVLPNITEAAEVGLHDLGLTGFLRDFGKIKIRGAIRVGPQFNARSCAGCHIGNGRGSVRVDRHSQVSDTVVKVSLPSGRSQLTGGPVPVPGIGTQLHDHAVTGVTPEARIALQWRVIRGTYGDGTPYELRVPRARVALTGKRLPLGARFSIRRAPPVFGSGLLDAVSQEEIEALADPEDVDRDGISGRPNVVWDVSRHSVAMGRFGFKAGAPSLKQQIAAAYASDMGISNPLFRLQDAVPDISSRVLSATTFYTATLAVPKARSQRAPSVVTGKQSFISMGCADCHVLELHTSQGLSAALSNQTIHPFTDLLLHDMGPGLADGRAEFQATGREWRTTPLWGIGLTGVVLGEHLESYLHDGRARSLEEAILWHGGEASRSKERFAAATAAERAELVRFLRSL